MISPSENLDNFSQKKSISKKEIINVMVGEIRRLIEYPKRGWLEEQKIPKKVLQAYNSLINLGFTEYLEYPPVPED